MTDSTTKLIEAARGLVGLWGQSNPDPMDLIAASAALRTALAAIESAPTGDAKTPMPSEAKELDAVLAELDRYSADTSWIATPSVAEVYARGRVSARREVLAAAIDTAVQAAHALGLQGRGLDGELLTPKPFLSDAPDPPTPGGPDIGVCPRCGGPADMGFDRCLPPSPYECSKCDPPTPGAK